LDAALIDLQKLPAPEQYPVSSATLAWLLATNPNGSQKERERATHTARDLASRHRDDRTLTTLAVALASAGDFPETNQSIREACSLTANSEEIALVVSDYDRARGELHVTKARVLRRDKDRPKNGEERVIELCGRAIDVLERHLKLRAQYVSEGRINHKHLFFHQDGTRSPTLNALAGAGMRR
jgi:hypothetical protein